MKPPIPLAQLDPHWIENQGQVCGISFNCPEHMTPETPDRWCRQVVPFTPAMSGTHVATWQANGATWHRTGGTYDEKHADRVEGFADLTLSPSIRSSCGYHGFITNGVVTCCGDSK